MRRVVAACMVLSPVVFPPATLILLVLKKVVLQFFQYSFNDSYELKAGHLRLLSLLGPTVPKRNKCDRKISWMKKTSLNWLRVGS
jgi:hypothetical protein